MAGGFASLYAWLWGWKSSAPGSPLTCIQVVGRKSRPTVSLDRSIPIVAGRRSGPEISGSVSVPILSGDQSAPTVRGIPC